MYPLKIRILRYAKVNKSLPTKLSELPPLEGFRNSITDVWGTEIKYLIEGTAVTLISYGKDQKPGGVGDDLDVIGTFETRSPSGHWLDEETDWTIRPLGNK
jgi:hypothetical protein